MMAIYLVVIWVLTTLFLNITRTERSIYIYFTNFELALATYLYQPRSRVDVVAFTFGMLTLVHYCIVQTCLWLLIWEFIFMLGDYNRKPIFIYTLWIFNTSFVFLKRLLVTFSDEDFRCISLPLQYAVHKNIFTTCLTQL